MTGYIYYKNWNIAYFVEGSDDYVMNVLLQYEQWGYNVILTNNSKKLSSKT